MFLNSSYVLYFYTFFIFLLTLETVLPIFITVLKVRFRNSLQLIRYSLLNVFHGAKIMSFETIFQFWVEEKVARTRDGRIRRLLSHTNVLLDQKLVNWNCCVARGVGRCHNATPSCFSCFLSQTSLFKNFSRTHR